MEVAGCSVVFAVCLVVFDCRQVTVLEKLIYVDNLRPRTKVTSSEKIRI